MQNRIIRSFDLIAKLVLLDNWIVNDMSTQKIVITSLAKGVSILDRDHPYALIVTDTSQPSSPTWQAGAPTPFGKNHEQFKAELFSAVTTVTNQTNSPGQNRAARGKVNRPSMAPNKKFPKLRISFQPSMSNLVSAGSKDGGAGLPTFALLSSEIQIKAAADFAIESLSLRLANFPSKNSCLGVTHLSSAWDEIKSVVQLAKAKRTLLEQREISSPITSHLPENSKFVRYFSYQKRMIFGLVERPNWGDPNATPKEPSLIVTARDSGGKYSWKGEFHYVEQESKLDSKSKGKSRSTGLDGLALSFDDIASVPIKNHEIFEKWNGYAAPKPIFQPARYPVLPEGVRVIEQKCANESNIPSIAELFGKEDPQIAMQPIIEQANLEKTSNPTTAKEYFKLTRKSSAVTPDAVVDTMDPSFMYSKLN